MPRVQKVALLAFLVLTLAACSSMKQIWDLKGIIVSSNGQVFTGKSSTVPMDIKTGNLRYEFTATSDPVDNGYPVSIKVDDSSIASVTQSASNPSLYTITGLKSGYTAVTASCSIYNFTFIVYVADTSRGITVDKLKQQRDDDIAKVKAEEDAKKEAEALAKQQAAEKAAAEAAAKKAAEAKAAEEAAKKAAAEAAAKASASFAPKAGDVYALDAQEGSPKKYVHFTSGSEMRMVHASSEYVEGWVYSIKFSAKDSKSENGIAFKNCSGTIAAFVDDSADSYSDWNAKEYKAGMKQSRRYIYPKGGSFDWEKCEQDQDGGKNINSTLYNTWYVDYRDEGINFPRRFNLKFNSNGTVTKTGPRYMFESTDNRDEVTKTYTFTNKDGLVMLQNGEAYYYDGKRLNDVWIVKKVTDSSLIQKIKSAEYYNPYK